MIVLLILGLIWAAVLVPPVLRSHAARKEAFLVSFGQVQPSGPSKAPGQRRSTSVQRRRRIAGGLLVAMASTLLAGLLPTFRVLLVVHLLLVDSFIAYIALLAHAANRAGRGAALAPARVAEVEEVAETVHADRVRRRWRGRDLLRGPPALPDLAPAAPLA